MKVAMNVFVAWWRWPRLGQDIPARNVVYQDSSDMEVGSVLCAIIMKPNVKSNTKDII
jgi:hypothetical protein